MTTQEMSDRELLELAAKAAGYEIIGWEMTCGVEVAILSDLSRWQPMSANEATDCMGDALRLAVKLDLIVNTHGSHVQVSYPFDTPLAFEKIGDDPCAATRLAIVRAAAEIGKQMK